MKRGDDVTVWNRTTAKARALEAFGARVADSPADAVRDVARVHLVLKDDAVVEEVVAALRPGLAAEHDHRRSHDDATGAHRRAVEAIE